MSHVRVWSYLKQAKKGSLIAKYILHIIGIKLSLDAHITIVRYEKA